MGLPSSRQIQSWSGQVARLAWRFRATTLLLMPALLVCLIPGAAEVLQYNSSELAAGQWFRLGSCHWTHWNADHAFWDILMFAMLAAVCERRSRTALLGATFGSAIAISAILWWLAPQLETYRGLSGLDSGLFALAAGGVLCEAWRDRQWTCLTGGLILVAGFVAKTCFEIITGMTLFVDSTSAAFVPVPHVHAVGALVGAAVGFRSSVQSAKHVG